MAMTYRSVFFLVAVAVLLLPMKAAAQDAVRIVQTNSAGDNVHIIDPTTNTVVGEITGIERAHGAQPSPDGRWLYVANESDDTVDVVDVAMLKVIKKIPLTGRPNNITVTPDGRKVYVAIAQSPRCARRDRYQHERDHRDDLGAWWRAQHICHTRREIRRGGHGRRTEYHGGGYRDRHAGVDDLFRSRDPPDGVRHES